MTGSVFPTKLIYTLTSRLDIHLATMFLSYINLFIVVCIQSIRQKLCSLRTDT